MIALVEARRGEDLAGREVLHAEFRVDPPDAHAFHVEVFAPDEEAAWRTLRAIGRAMARV